MDYLLYVRVVKARDLPVVNDFRRTDLFVEVSIGKYKGTTIYINHCPVPVWNVVFAFSQDQMQASVVNVVVRYKDKDDFVGIVSLDLNQVPLKVPPDSPLMPQWYSLEDSTLERNVGKLMLAVWTGTQVDEAFREAVLPTMDYNTATYTHLHPMIFHTPKLWYLRVNVIQAQELEPTDRTCFPEVHVKAQIGNQALRTKNLQSRTLNSLWNENLSFVVAEPFEDQLVLTVENRVSPGNDENLGSVIIPSRDFNICYDDQPTPTRWYNLEKSANGVDHGKNESFSSKLHLQLCLDGRYHVLDDSAYYGSDLHPAAKEFYRTSIGLLELGIFHAERIVPMKTRDRRETSDTYCISKYGNKWVRSKTVVDSLHPKYNEQYSWDVFDRATVLAVGVFDDNHFEAKGSYGKKDLIIGKVEIQVSTLEPGRTYTHKFPLLRLHPSGVKLMGELHLSIRFSCTSFASILYQYSHPLLPKMHYIQPISEIEQKTMRHHAVKIVSMCLARNEGPLRREAVEYMYELFTDGWSMRRSKANYFRLMSVFSGLLQMSRSLGVLCSWKNPVKTIIFHVLFLVLVCCPVLILPLFFLYMFLCVLWNFRFRPLYPPHKNTMISNADNCHPDELDEEFDTYPTSCSPQLVMMRYDRLRSMAGMLQNLTGDFAIQGERLQSLLSWRDPFASGVFAVFCLMAAIVLYVTPFQILIALAGLYLMRHPRFRSSLSALPINFLRRLPDRTEAMF